VKFRYTGVADLFAPHRDGEYILLPLDPAQFDAAGVDEAVVALREAQGFHLTPWSDLRESDREEWRRELRAALAAYARTVAGGGA
jgi:hypothetical protein